MYLFYHQQLYLQYTPNSFLLHFSLREQQLSAAHHAEVDSLSSQHRHQTQLLLADFNKAKEMLNARIMELEKQSVAARSSPQTRQS